MKNEKLRSRFATDFEFLPTSFFVCYERGGMSVSNASVEKSFLFSIRIVKLYHFLTKEKREYVLAKQLLRCGTSIGANISEAQYAQSNADFQAKMHIALKEASETEYWLRLLYRTEYLSDRQYKSLHGDVEELLRILAAICKNNTC